jgi:chromosomal replication initiator protein
MNVENIWKESLSFIEEHLNKQSFDTWIRPLVLRSVNEGEAFVAIPNRFFEEWLREHYYGTLCEAIARATERKAVHVQFVVESDSRPVEPPPVPPKEERRKVVRAGRNVSLNPRYKFETFVVGSCNQFAHAACLAVAESPARAYNPLFIYGGVGLGKTHLLHALGNSTLNRNPGAKIAYVSSEQFTNEVIGSIRYDRMTEFRNKYRGVDMLLIDDIQFIAGKERTQEEFFHTFNTLYEAHKQIVLTSDRYPKEMPGVEERLRSRFEWGLIADLQTPDLETKIAILEKKAESEGITLPDDVAYLLATGIKTNVRELEGSLIRLGAFASLTGQPITIDLAKKVLRDAIEERKRFVSVDEIQKAVAERFHLKPAELKSKRRTKALVLPRQITMYLCREITKMSYPEIGRHFGGKDHTTVMHACRQIEKQTETDGSMKHMVETMIQHFRK